MKMYGLTKNSNFENIKSSQWRKKIQILKGFYYFNAYVYCTYYFVIIPWYLINIVRCYAVSWYFYNYTIDINVPTLVKFSIYIYKTPFYLKYEKQGSRKQNH